MGFVPTRGGEANRGVPEDPLAPANVALKCVVAGRRIGFVPARGERSEPRRA